MTNDSPLRFDRLSVEDFNEVLDQFLDFWDHEEPKVRHHPMFVRELGDASLAVRDGDVLVGYLLGLVSSARGDDGRPWAYVHMVAVRRSHRRRGLAGALYERFFEHALQAGCSRVRATAAPHPAAEAAA
ncbi:MAG: GNAT family N-acetyltransferase, partial [Acidobacteriota bacterium]